MAPPGGASAPRIGRLGGPTMTQIRHTVYVAVAARTALGEQLGLEIADGQKPTLGGERWFRYAFLGADYAALSLRSRAFFVRTRRVRRINGVPNLASIITNMRPETGARACFGHGAPAFSPKI